MEKGKGKLFLKLKNIPFHSFLHESYTMHIHCHLIIPNGIPKIIHRRCCFYIPLHFMAILAFSTSLLSYITNITLIHLYIYGYIALFVSGLGKLFLKYHSLKMMIFFTDEALSMVGISSNIDVLKMYERFCLNTISYQIVMKVLPLKTFSVKVVCDECMMHSTVSFPSLAEMKWQAK